MVTPAPTMCAYHRRRPRVATCGTCEKPICADCIVRTGVGVKCRACTGVKAVKAPKAVQLERGAATPAPAGARPAAAAGGRPRWALPVLAAGVVVLAVAGFGLLSRGSGKKAPREQVEAGPIADFTDRQTEFVGAGGQRIGGTLTLPTSGEGRGVPAVLIIPGQGAIDRNALAAANPPDALRDAFVSTVGGVALGAPDPLYKDLSESLAKAGVASFRYDKRGTKPTPIKDGQKLSFDDEVADARAAFDLLSRRAEIGGSPLVVLGQDTGAIIAMRLASGDPRVKGVVAISTPARKFADALAADLTRSRGAAVGESFRTAAATLADTGKAPAPDSLPDILRPLFAPGQDAYLNSLFSLDPAAEVFNVAVPVLLVRGGADPAVTSADMTRLSGSLRVNGQVIVGSNDADRNLALAGAGHEHSNTATTPMVQRDADTRAALTAWVKTQLSS